MWIFRFNNWGYVSKYRKSALPRIGLELYWKRYSYILYAPHYTFHVPSIRHSDQNIAAQRRVRFNLCSSRDYKQSAFHGNNDDNCSDEDTDDEVDVDATACLSPPCCSLVPSKGIWRRLSLNSDLSHTPSWVATSLVSFSVRVFVLARKFQNVYRDRKSSCQYIIDETFMSEINYYPDKII